MSERVEKVFDELAALRDIIDQERARIEVQKNRIQDLEDLVARLRAELEALCDEGGKLALQAADRIEQLEQENERLKEKHDE